jgi:hypothetical protein
VWSGRTLSGWAGSIGDRPNAGMTEALRPDPPPGARSAGSDDTTVASCAPICCRVRGGSSGSTGNTSPPRLRVRANALIDGGCFAATPAHRRSGPPDRSAGSGLGARATRPPHRGPLCRTASCADATSSQLPAWGRAGGSAREMLILTPEWCTLCVKLRSCKTAKGFRALVIFAALPLTCRLIVERRRRL